MAKERCPVSILDLYISKFPKDPVSFYCKPIPNAPLDETSPWYYNIPVGRNLLSRMVPDLYSEAGLSCRKTNHSLQVSSATRLFEAGVPEKVIQQRTGHRSLEALRMYERVTEQQEQAVSKILSGETDVYEDTKGPDSSNPSISSRAMLSGIQYNNCTVNVYSSPAQPSFCPMIPYGFPPPAQPFDYYSYYPMPPVHGPLPPQKTHMSKIELHVYFLLLQSNFPFISYQVFHYFVLFNFCSLIKCCMIFI